MASLPAPGPLWAPEFYPAQAPVFLGAGKLPPMDLLPGQRLRDTLYVLFSHGINANGNQDGTGKDHAAVTVFFSYLAFRYT